jgi:hypothetical protein
MKKIATTVIIDGRSVDLFRGRHSDFVGESTHEAALKVIQARNHVHGERGMFKVTVEWQPPGWIEGPTNAGVELYEATKALIKAADDWESCKDIECERHSEALTAAIVTYRVKREIKSAEDEAMEAANGKI